MPSNGDSSNGKERTRRKKLEKKTKNWRGISSAHSQKVRPRFHESKKKKRICKTARKKCTPGKRGPIVKEGRDRRQRIDDRKKSTRRKKRWSIGVGEGGGNKEKNGNGNR